MTTVPPTASRPEQAAALRGLPAPSKTSGAASTLRAAAGCAALHTPHHHAATVLLPKPAAPQEAARHLLPGPHPPGAAPHHGTCHPPHPRRPLRAGPPFPLDFCALLWEVGGAPQALTAPGSQALGSCPPYPPAQILVASEVISLSLRAAVPGASGRRVTVSLEGLGTGAWRMGCSGMEQCPAPENAGQTHSLVGLRWERSRAGYWPAVALPWSCREKAEAL